MPTSCVYLLYNPAGFCYVGQTKDLSTRLRGHRFNFKNDGVCTSKRLGPDWDCEILEELDAEDLRDAEQFYYEFWSELCPGMLVNRCKPGRTEAEYKDQYRDKRIEYNRQYRVENRDELHARQRLSRAQKKKNLIKDYLN